MYSGSAERRRIRIDKIDVLVARIKEEEIDSAKMVCLPCKIKSKYLTEFQQSSCAGPIYNSES